ncbi:MAG: hypothetical protein MJ075_07485 [Oscillospiraceae bacterium]|nr:hypothetical protein [Oscillospiraceae bacterium]
MYELKHEPSLTPPEETALPLDCGHDAYIGDLVFTRNKESCCVDCIRDWLSKLDGDALAGVAEYFGYTVAMLVDFDGNNYGMTWPVWE